MKQYENQPNNVLMNIPKNVIIGLRPYSNPLIRVFFRFYQPIQYQIIEGNIPTSYLSYNNQILPFEGLGRPYENMDYVNRLTS